MPNNTKNKGQGSKTRTVIQHTFRGIREPIIADAYAIANNPVVVNASGEHKNYYVLSAKGMKAASLPSSSNLFGTMTVEKPHLDWLMRTSGTFKQFRITRARLIFTGNQGEDVDGMVHLHSSPDLSDVNRVLDQTSYLGKGARSFSLASCSGSKEQGVNLDIDTRWKIVSEYLSVPGGVIPFSSGANNSVITINSANDLCFGVVSVLVLGAPANSNTGILSLEYDVEFRGPVSFANNA